MPAPIIIAAAAGQAISIFKKHPWIIPTIIASAILPLFIIITVIGGTMSGLQTVQVFNFGGNCITEDDGNFFESEDNFNSATADCGDISNQSFAADGEWVYPVDQQYAYVTSPYGNRILNGKLNFHDAVDLGAPYGAPVYAATNGKVVSVVKGNGGTGFCGEGAFPTGAGVTLAHANDVKTLYWHIIPASNLKVGDEVKSGQIIGYVANKGYVCGAHLHFSVHVGPLPNYPSPYNQNPVRWFETAGKPLR